MDTPSKRRAGRRPKSEAGKEPLAHIVWRNGRAYGDFRNWAPWGARSTAQEPLVAAGEKFATSDQHTATILFARRLEELRALRKEHPDGIPVREEDPLDRIPIFVGYHIARVAAKRATLSTTELAIREARLTHAARYLVEVRERTRLREITVQDVQAWLDHLEQHPPRPLKKRRGGRRGDLSGDTRGRYLRALGRMLHRARHEGRITENPVELLMPEDRPVKAPAETPVLEISEAALLLEAARRYKPRGNEPHPENFPKLATYLLTGGRGREVEELEIADVDLRRDMIRIRPNATRRALTDPRRKIVLKNQGSERWIPLWPQLKEILGAFLDGPHAPEGPRLFTGGDMRSWLNSVAESAGFAPGYINRRVLRVTYATTRLQTLDRGEPVSVWTVAREMGHADLSMLEKVYGRLGRVRQRREHVEYRWDEWAPEMEPRLRERLRLTDGQLRTLRKISEHPAGLSSRDWQLEMGDNPGTFFPRRERLRTLGLVMREGTGRGSRFLVTPEGTELLSHYPALRPDDPDPRE